MTGVTSVVGVPSTHLVGSGNGLSPHRRQAITWTNTDNKTFVKNIKWNLNHDMEGFFQEPFEKTCLQNDRYSVQPEHVNVPSASQHQLSTKMLSSSWAMYSSLVVSTQFEGSNIGCMECILFCIYTYGYSVYIHMAIYYVSCPVSLCPFVIHYIVVSYELQAEAWVLYQYH